MKIGARYYKEASSFMPFQVYDTFQVTVESPKFFTLDNGTRVSKDKGFDYYNLKELTPEAEAQIKADNIKNRKYNAMKIFAGKVTQNGFTAEQLLEMYDKLKDFMQ